MNKEPNAQMRRPPVTEDEVDLAIEQVREEARKTSAGEVENFEEPR